MSLDTLIPLHDLFRVDWKLFVRVDYDTEETRIRLKNEKENNHQTILTLQKNLCVKKAKINKLAVLQLRHNNLHIINLQ